MGSEVSRIWIDLPERVLVPIVGQPHGSKGYLRKLFKQIEQTLFPTGVRCALVHKVLQNGQNGADSGMKSRVPVP